MARRPLWPGVIAGLALVAGSVLMAPAGAAVAAPVKANQVSAGYLHTCALTSKGGVKCWGYNGYGELGDNSLLNSAKPVNVYGLGSKVKAISSGYFHTCALTTKGAVKCWGYNGYGQLGDNTTTNSPKPIAVAGLTKGVKSISSGYFHTCAITSKGAVKCWGYNLYGQLGDNSTTNSSTPVGVYGLTRGVKAISTGLYHSCALTSKGAAKCWGFNADGQLGDNTTTNSPKPVAVYGLTKSVRQISAGYLGTCAVTSKRAAKCWGFNGDGQLGNNTTTDSHKPTGVYGLGSGIASVKTSVSHTCALTTKGKVKCWGNNAYGELGDNSTTNSLKPLGAYNLDKSSTLSLGYLHTCVVTSKKAVKCWGYNEYGQLGDNTTTSSHKPVKVFGF